MRRENVEATEKLVQLRQRGITMLILVQNAKMVDTNVRRLASIRALKFGIDFVKAACRKLVGDAKKIFYENSKSHPH